MPSIPGGNPRPLGQLNVASAGTLVKLTQNFTDMEAADARTPLASSVFIQALPGNTGVIYFGTKTLVRATGVGVYVVLAAGEGFTLSLGSGINAFNILDYRIDANTANDKAYASFSVA